MSRKIKFQSLYLYLFLIVASAGFTACLKKKTSADPDKNYHSAESYQKEFKEDREDTYDVVEQMPQFPGGESKLMYFLSRKIKYPVIAQENGIQGRVICQFVVTKTGRVVDPQVVRSLDPSCDKEAIRVLKLLPRWIPGKKNGENVNVRYTIPISFKLQ